MRVLQLITQDRGGPVDHAVDVAATLAERGHDSHLAGPPGAYADTARRRGVHWHELVAPGKFDPRGWRGTDRLLGRLRPDVLHCQDRRAGLVGRLAARRRGLPAVYTVHGVADSLAHLVPGNRPVAAARRRDALAYHTLERRLARMAPGPVVVPCEALGRYATTHMGLPAGLVRVVPNGVGPRWLEPRPPRAVTQDAPDVNPPTAVWLGLMEPVKRLPDLLAALADVPDLRLLLVGDGPERPVVEQALDRYRLRGRVELTGFRSDPLPALAEADLFVLPSAAEACPLALLQAMALGLAPVASAVGGVPEIVRDGVDGLLVPADAAGDLRDALLRVTKDDALRAAMGASARRRVADMFSLERCVAGLLAVYEEAAA